MIRVSENNGGSGKKNSSGRVVLFWMLSYISIQAILFFTYRYRHSLSLDSLKNCGWMIICAAGLWVIGAFCVIPSTWRFLRSTAGSILNELGRVKSAVLVLIILMGWIRIPGTDWFKPGLMAMGLYFAGNFSGLILFFLLISKSRCGNNSPLCDRRLGREILSLSRGKFLLLSALLCFSISTVFCRFVLRPIPHISDETAYLYQARTYASAHIVNISTAPDIADILSPEFVWDDPHRYSIFPPGWPAVLAIGVCVALTWFVNPLLAGGCAIFLYWMVREAWGELRARYAVLLLCICPFFLFMSGTLMSHTLALLAALMSVSGFLRGRRSWRWATVGGAGMVILFLTRPLEGAVLGLLLGLAFAYRLIRRKTVLPLVPLFVLATAGPILWMSYNNTVGRGWLDTPVHRYFLKFGEFNNQFGFGPDRGIAHFHNLGRGHSQTEAAFNLQYNLHSGNEKFWGWPGGSAPVIALGLLGWSRKRVPKYFLVGLLVMAGGLWCYWYHGECFGPRYYFSLLPVMIMLSLNGILILAKILNRPMSAVIIPAMAFTFLVHVPLYGSTFYHNTRGVSQHLRDEVKRPEMTPAVVLVSDSPKPYFTSTVNLNDTSLENDVLYARDRNQDADIRALEKRFPNRFIYRYRKGKWKLLVKPRSISRK